MRRTVFERRKIHLLPYNDNWIIKLEGSRSALVTRTSEENAYDQAKRLCRADRADLIVHADDGSVSTVLRYEEIRRGFRPESAHPVQSSSRVR